MIPLLLIATALVGLVLTMLGFPGIWVFLLVATSIKLYDPSIAMAWTALWIGYGLAVVAEGIEWVVSVRYTRKYGGSNKAVWGAVLGGIVGAMVGLPIPVIGSVVGSFLGSFAGALAVELATTHDHLHAGRVAWGSLLGRVVATTAKIGLSILIAVILIISSWT